MFFLRADVFFLNYFAGPSAVGVYSVATNLVATDNNLFHDIYLRDRQLATTARISNAARPRPSGGGASGGPNSGWGHTGRATRRSAGR